MGIGCMKKVLIGLFFYILWGVKITLAADIIDLQRALQITSQNNGYILAASQAAAAKQKGALQAKAFNNPKIRATLGHEKTEDIEQDIPFYSKRSKAFAVANTDATIAQKQSIKTSLEVKTEVIKKMYAYSVILQKHNLAELRIKRFKHLQTYINTRLFASPQKKVQKHIVETRLALVAKQLAEIENEEQIAWNELNLFLNLEKQNTIISVPFAVNPKQLNLSSLISKAIDANPELSIVRSEIDLVKNETALAKVEYLPDFVVGATRSNQNAEHATHSLVIGASVPLFNQNKAKIAGLKTLELARQTKYNFDLKVLQNKMQNLFTEYQKQAQIIAILPMSKIEEGLKNLDEADKNFLRDTIEFLTYIEYDMQSYEMFFEVLNAQYNYAATIAELMLASGQIDTDIFS
jgi:outer membrane protein TolC